MTLNKSLPIRNNLGMPGQGKSLTISHVVRSLKEDTVDDNDETNIHRVVVCIQGSEFSSASDLLATIAEKIEAAEILLKHKLENGDSFPHSNSCLTKVSKSKTLLNSSRNINNSSHSSSPQSAVTDSSSASPPPYENLLSPAKITTKTAKDYLREKLLPGSSSLSVSSSILSSTSISASKSKRSRLNPTSLQSSLAVVLFIDEVHRAPKSAIESLRDIAHSPGSRLVVVGVSNELDYSLHRDSEMLAFEPYSIAGLISIVKDKVCNLIDEASAKFIARNIFNQRGKVGIHYKCGELHFSLLHLIFFHFY